MDHTLFTYRNLEELRKIQEEREVFAFMFGETKDMLDSCSKVCIDISALVHFLITNKNNIEPTYINFTSMAEDTVVIAEVAMVRRIPAPRKRMSLSHIPGKRYINTIMRRIWT